jgi:hypothetical protein
MVASLHALTPYTDRDALVAIHINSSSTYQCPCHSCIHRQCPCNNKWVSRTFVCCTVHLLTTVFIAAITSPSIAGYSQRSYSSLTPTNAFNQPPQRMQQHGQLEPIGSGRSGGMVNGIVPKKGGGRYSSQNVQPVSVKCVRAFNNVCCTGGQRRVAVDRRFPRLGRTVAT